MRAPQEIQATVTAATVKIQDERPILQAQLCLELPLPKQDADLPRCLEAGIERGGQMLIRRLFQHAVEQADAELILAQRGGKQGRGILCRGTTPFTFKTVFGTVQIRRRRIEPQADGTTEVPSAHAWQTPRQVALTAGLRDAACDGLLRDSAQQVVARIDARAGESGVLAQTIVLEIVHAEGEQLQAAAHARAEAIDARDPEALRLFVPATSQEEQGAEPGGRDDGEDEAEAAATPALIGFPGSPTDQAEVKRDHPREVDPDVVLVELDEVKVHAQARTGRKQVLALTALVLIAGRCWHLAAATAQELAYQVGAVLGGPRGTRRLLVLADGARWILEWFEGLGVSDKTMIVCWWHLVKRCQQDLSREYLTRSQFLARHFRRVNGRPQAALMKHGQPVKVSRVNFERAIHDASITFGMWIKRVEWSPDRTSAKVSGLDMRYDEEAVHAIGEVWIFAKLLVEPLDRFLQETLLKQLSG